MSRIAYNQNRILQDYYQQMGCKLLKFLTGIIATILLSQASHASIIELEIVFDDYASDISWKVTNIPDNLILYSSPLYSNSISNTTVVESFDLAAGSYFFEIFDSYGDGLCCNEGNGSYLLRQDAINLYTSNGQFNSGEKIEFSVSSVPVPAAFWLFGSAIGLFGLIRRNA